MRTSYGVRFFERAYARLSLPQFAQNAASWSCASRNDVVVRRKSYVAGNRNPSSFMRDVWPKQGTTARRVAITYPARSSATGLWRLRSAIFATAATRSAISARVNPSGKTTRNGFGGGGGGGGRPTMARAGGKDPEKLPDALARARELIASALAS